MSSKAKLRYTELKEKYDKVRVERQRAVRALAGLIRKNGPLTLTYQEACNIEEDDQVDVQFDQQKGIYTITLKGYDAKQLGSRSDASGVSGGEGNVGGLIPKAGDEPVAVGDEVRESDKYNPDAVRLLPDNEEEEGRSE